jgi:hypothetical protein
MAYNDNTSEYRLGENLEGCGRCQIWDVLEGLRKLSARIISLRTEIWTRNLPNINRGANQSNVIFVNWKYPRANLTKVNMRQKKSDVS